MHDSGHKVKLRCWQFAKWILYLHSGVQSWLVILDPDKVFVGLGNMEASSCCSYTGTIVASWACWKCLSTTADQNSWTTMMVLSILLNLRHVKQQVGLVILFPYTWTLKSILHKVSFKLHAGPFVLILRQRIDACASPQFPIALQQCIKVSRDAYERTHLSASSWMLGLLLSVHNSISTPINSTSTRPGIRLASTVYWKAWLSTQLVIRNRKITFESFSIFLWP